MSRTYAILALLLTLAWPQFPAAKDMASLYDDATLQERRPHYQRGVMLNFTEIFLPRMKADERRRLSTVQFAFPLRGSSGDPFEFYAIHPPATIVLPVMSIKFIDDISVALAWLNRHGYTTDTVYRYIGMLKYADIADFADRYPSPFQALGVPQDALSDPLVADDADQIFNIALAFIILHELGHIYYGHPGNGADVPSAISRANEAAADAFAIEMLRRTGDSPTGASFIFMAWAYWAPNRGDFATEDGYQRSLQLATHPLTSERIRTLANELRQYADDFARHANDVAAARRDNILAADMLAEVADILAGPGEANFIDNLSRSTTSDMLSPRRFGEIPAGATPTTAGAFEGAYGGQLGLPLGPVPVRTVLHRQGNHVRGQYYWGAVQGNLSGLAANGVLVFAWQDSSGTGHGLLRLDPTGKGFAGSWGSGASDRDRGTWTGERIAQ